MTVCHFRLQPCLPPEETFTVPVIKWKVSEWTSRTER